MQGPGISVPPAFTPQSCRQWSGWSGCAPEARALRSPGNSTRDERAEALLAVPGSVLCLGSALSYHELGTWEPPEIYLAVKSGRKVRIPDFPPIRVHHFSSRFFSLGLIERTGKGGAFRVYDVERTICDLFRFRRSLGTDVAAAALREYVRRRSRNIPKLLDYSKQPGSQVRFAMHWRFSCEESRSVHSSPGSR